MAHHRAQFDTLKARLREPPERIIALFGPRQTGKSTIARAVLRSTDRYLAVDEPERTGVGFLDSDSDMATVAGAQRRDSRWLVRNWERARLDAERLPQGCILVVDEVQKIPEWIAARMRNGDYAANLAQRLTTEDYASLARQVALPLLRAFPVHCAQSVPLLMLDGLLVAALRTADRTDIAALIAKKRSRTSMSVSQRVHWMAAEVIAVGENNCDRLWRFVQSRDRRVTQLSEFLFAADSLLAGSAVPTLACFIRLLAPSTRRLGGTASRLVGAEYKASRSIERMVAALSERDSTDGEAVNSLERFAADHTLGEWRPSLAAARDRQRVLRRDAAYRHPTVEQTCRTLSGGTPANVADLAALLTDRFLELARRIRTGNTDDWRQYWNEPRGQAPTPKHEDQCRDALLSDLRQHLPAGVDAQPEGQYANDKRADIRVACQDFEVPVEIKKNRHPDLWSAAKNQLVAQYVTAPATSGYGVYLVFWFGRDRMPPPPVGAPPSGPDELKIRLEAVLSDADLRKIAAVVIDVSRAEGK